MESPSLASPFSKMMLSSRRSSMSALKSTRSTPVFSRDEMLLKLLMRTPDQPLRSHFEDFNSIERSFSPLRDENTPPPRTEQQRIPNNCHRLEGKPLEKGATPEYSEMSSSPKTPTARGDYKVRENYPTMCLVQREIGDRQLPDHSRDKSALKDSTENYFTYCDSQTRTAEDKKTATDYPKSIQDVMQNVVVYVEVRTGEDNRSAGVKKVISQLGAKVNDKLLRDTTHVVFKDGTPTTYNKAKKWGIPLVSILWIEECKKQMKLMDPILFPISNIERYENPELYGKFKRMKSMQPDAEEKSRRNRSKTVTETEIEKTAKTNSAIVVPRKPKDKLGEILYEFQEKLRNTPDDNGDCLQFESKLLQRIKNSPFTPTSHMEQNKTGIKNTIKGNVFSAVSEESEDYANSHQSNARKYLKFNKTQKKLPGSRLTAAALKATKSEGDCPTSVNAAKRSTRRSSMSAAIVSTESSSKKDQNPVSEKINNEIITNMVGKPTTSKNHSTSSRSTMKNTRRRTLFTPNSKHEFPAINGESKRTIDFYFSKESNKRRTMFNPGDPIEETAEPVEQETPTELCVDSKTDQVAEERKTDSNLPSFNLLEEHASTLLFSSTRSPQVAKRRTLFDISMDIIDQRLQSINKSAKQNKMRRDSIESEHSITPVNQPRTISRITDSSLQTVLDNEILTEDINKNEKSLSTEVSEQVPKKRKLFAPLDMISSQTVSSLKDDALKSSAKKRSKKFEDGPSASKRRRTVFVPAPLVEEPRVQETKPDRRRTMGFDVIRKIATSHSGGKAELAVPFLV